MENENEVESEDSGGEEELDPRIQSELERLNRASEEINQLELSLQDARSKFRATLDESTRELETLAEKLGGCVDKARPYYQARMNARTIQAETQKSALRFERACSMHAAAKEMVNVAEQGFLNKGQQFDTAWQEMLNHATTKVNEAETEIMESELEHAKMTYIFHESEKSVKRLQREHRRSISKSRPYFDKKSEYNRKMEEQKRRVGKISEQLKIQKSIYSCALKTLERISDEIHAEREKRKERKKLGKRISGVGAEAPEPSPEERSLSDSLDTTLKFTDTTDDVKESENRRARSPDKAKAISSPVKEATAISSPVKEAKAISSPVIKAKSRTEARRDSAPSKISSSPSRVSDPSSMILNVGALRNELPSFPYATVEPKTKKSRKHKKSAEAVALETVANRPVTKATSIGQDTVSKGVANDAKAVVEGKKDVAKEAHEVAKEDVAVAKDAVSKDTVSMESDDLLDTDSDSSSVHIPDDEMIENVMNEFSDEDLPENDGKERFRTLPANMNFADLKNYFKQGELKKWGDVEDLH